MRGTYDVRIHTRIFICNFFPSFLPYSSSLLANLSYFPHQVFHYHQLPYLLEPTTASSTSRVSFLLRKMQFHLSQSVGSPAASGEYATGNQDTGAPFTEGQHWAYPDLVFWLIVYQRSVKGLAPCALCYKGFQEIIIPPQTSWLWPSNGNGHLQY
jgi:hypothetical protein